MNLALVKGEIIDNNSLVEIFKCSPQGGMRYSKRTNTLVLVSNHVKGIYNDRWEGNTLHYTGMGQEGDQSLDFRANNHLAKSNQSNISIVLFEVFKSQEYTFQGEVKLISAPYQETQLDNSGKKRLVWMFPIGLSDGSQPFSNLKDLDDLAKVKEKKAQKMNLTDLHALIQTLNKKPTKRSSTVDQYDRNEFIKEYALRRAKGNCQLCGEKAPFTNTDGRPFLEVHHINYLRNGGEDSITNVVALCPNCHRKVHILENPADVKKMALLATEKIL